MRNSDIRLIFEEHLKSCGHNKGIQDIIAFTEGSLAELITSQIIGLEMSRKIDELKIIIRELSDIASELGEFVANANLFKSESKKVTIPKNIKETANKLEALLSSLHKRNL